MKVHAALAATLAEHDITTMFGVMGDGNMFFVDSFACEQGGRYIAAAHEASAVLMALGYASAARRVGVATVTQGPGLANTTGALIEASRERLPIVVVAGDTPVDARGHFQKIDQASLVTPTGAGFEQARSAKTATRDLARAIRRAYVERRPVVLNVPSDLNWQDVENPPLRPLSAALSQAVMPDPEAMDAALGIIAAARRPIVLAGAGATSPEARAAVQRLSDRIGAPLMTTLLAKGLYAGEKWNLGVFGTFSTARATEAIMACDAVVAIGASLNRWTGGGSGWPFFDGKRLVHCDIDPGALGAEYPVDGPVVADAAAFADTVVSWLDEAGTPSTSFRENVFAGPEQPVAGRASSGGCVDLTTAMIQLNAALPADRTIAVDGGRFVGEAARHLDVPGPEHWLYPWRGFAGVGVGLPAAMGAGCAAPDVPTVAVVGDGGFMLGGLVEFNTAVRHGIDLITVVCNDGAYGAEYTQFRNRGLQPTMTIFEWPELAPIAEALGGQAFTVRSDGDLAKLADVIAERDRPLLIDIKLDPASVPDLAD